MPRDAPHTRLDAQYAFLMEADRLKTVERANRLMNRSRFENSAEHSWHACLLALLCAPLAGPEADLDRALEMLMLHDIVEVDAGDHPIHILFNPEEISARERAAADRIYGLLPEALGRELRATYDEFEAMETPTARFAKSVDFLAPALQCIGAGPRPAEEDEIVAGNLSRGRARKTREMLPALHEFTAAAFEGRATDPDMAARFAFWCEADRLKSVIRATPIADGSRRENSGEHSWHIMLYARVLADHAGAGVDIARVLRMLLLHDIVEVDAGDTPIHGAVTPEALAAQEAAECAAADRLFGMLPGHQAREFRTIWDEFEAAETPTAVFAKSIDRVQPLLHNLSDDGGSWRTYDVKLSQLETRIGTKITRGCPDLWPYVRAKVTPWFVARGAL
ncbi:HD domain-containing protein [Celeribacter indicus]|uniref:5'-deoxynucleotidase n=1 Tax=Celeribacter indicus TaxID=1208324 RepID=A0A0B5E1X9_9RHOB|nr:HD domain-containing protein [Celeribacter indicus]AJE47056.1 HD domain-containing protein [Celeribacter indicus]SDW91991.1 putative hydrolases of HD superfamily [Celeribacter indicus]